MGRSSASALLRAHSLSIILSDDRVLLRDQTLHIGFERIGLVGANGAGKTCLLKLLMGHLPEQSGVIERPDLMLMVEQDHLGDLSPGQRALQLIRRAIDQDPDILILDEPTNHLDQEARRELLKMLSDWHKGVVVASHDRELLRTMDRIIELRDGVLHNYGGGYDTYATQKAAQDASLEQQEHDVRKDLRHQKKVAQKTKERQERRSQRAAKNAPNSGLSALLLGLRKSKAEVTSGRLQKQAADSQQQQLEKLRAIQTQKSSLQHWSNHWSDDAVPPGKLMLHLEDLNFSFSGHEDSYLWKTPLNFSARGPRRVAISGRNGSGKTTLLRLICQELQPTAGICQLKSRNVQIVDQEMTSLRHNQSLLEWLRSPGLDESRLRRMAARAGFKEDLLSNTAVSLSGGEKMRAALLKTTLHEPAPDILILDEPTNNLDLESQIGLAHGLKHFQGLLLVVSHDRMFLESIGIDDLIQLD